MSWNPTTWAAGNGTLNLQLQGGLLRLPTIIRISRAKSLKHSLPGTVNTHMPHMHQLACS